MSWIISSLIFLVVTAVSLLIIAQLPLGIEVDSFGKAFISALIFGVLTAIATPVLFLLKLPIINILFFPILILVYALLFGITAKIVVGFRLRSIWSAVVGAIALGLVNSILFFILGQFFPAVTG